MTSREIDLVREYLGREIGQLRLKLDTISIESKSDHADVKRKLDILAERVDKLEDFEMLEEGRKTFRAELRNMMVKVNSIFIATGTFGILLLEHYAKG